MCNPKVVGSSPGGGCRQSFSFAIPKKYSIVGSGQKETINSESKSGISQ